MCPATEVKKLHHAVVVHHDVQRFQVAVDDPGVMRLRQSVGDLDGILQCFIQPQPLPADQLVESPARGRGRGRHDMAVAAGIE